MGDDLEWRPDPASPVYVYAQVADHIANLVETGALAVGARLPGELEIARQYGISKDTARRAIRELRDRGLAITVPYKGTFIQATPALADPSEDDLEQ